MNKPRGPLTLLKSSRKLRWLVAVVFSLPVLYVASFGPACRCVDARKNVRRLADFYAPLLRGVDRLPVALRGHARHALLWYGGATAVDVTLHRRAEDMVRNYWCFPAL
jgi:hypothetical protein